MARKNKSLKKLVKAVKVVVSPDFNLIKYAYTFKRQKERKKLVAVLNAPEVPVAEN